MEKIMATLYYVRKGKKELQIQVLGIGIHFSKVKGIWLCLIVKEKLHLSEALWIWERSLRAVWRETLNWANFRNNLVKHSRKYGTRLFFFWFKTVFCWLKMYGTSWNTAKLSCFSLRTQPWFLHIIHIIVGDIYLHIIYIILKFF